MRFYLYQCLLVETKKSITTRYGISDKLSSPSIKLYLWNVKSFYQRKFSCELIPVSKIQIGSVVPELSSITIGAQSTWAPTLDPPPPPKHSPSPKQLAERQVWTNCLVGKFTIGLLWWRSRLSQQLWLAVLRLASKAATEIVSRYLVWINRTNHPKWTRTEH